MAKDGVTIGGECGNTAADGRCFKALVRGGDGWEAGTGVTVGGAGKEEVRFMSCLQNGEP